jgi:hypothetical protein
MALLSLYPTAIAHQHLVLTESGTTFFVAAMVALAVWRPGGAGAQWKKTAALALAGGVAYYWRQTLLVMAPTAAAVHLVAHWRSAQRFRQGLAVALVQAALIGGVPFLMARPWQAFTNNERMTSVHIYQGLLKQALIPPDHPLASPYAERYRLAIEEARQAGNFYSGLRNGDHRALLEMFAGGRASRDGGPQLLFELVREHPGAYLRAVGRTFLLLGGAKSLENENVIHREMVLSAWPPAARIDNALGELSERILADFGYPARESLVLSAIQGMTLPYDRILMLASAVTAVGLLVGLLTRNARLLALCAIPVANLVPFALLMDSYDRYGFPAYPMFLADLVILPMLLSAEIARRRAAAAASRVS